MLEFEISNRAYFTRSISDRSDEFFERYAERHREALARQEAGEGAFYLLLDDEARVLGRFNLYLVGGGVAEVGYRMAESAAGRGLATEALGDLCLLAASRHGIRTLRAATSQQNLASQRVLLKAGFVRTGPADPADVGGKPGSWYERAAQAAQGPLRVAR